MSNSKARCSLVAHVARPLSGKPFGRVCRWILRMACGKVYDYNTLEPPVWVLCDGATNCIEKAPPAPKKTRPKFDF